MDPTNPTTDMMRRQIPRKSRLGMGPNPKVADVPANCKCNSAIVNSMRLGTHHQLIADKDDVLAEDVELVGEGGGDFHFVDGFLDVSQAREQFFPILGCRVGKSPSFDR